MTVAKKTSGTKKPSKAARTLSNDRKAAMTRGRQEARVVSRYLEALAASKAKRGRQRTQDSIGAQLVRIERELPDAAALRRLELTQKKFDLLLESEQLRVRSDIAAVEKEFVKIARSYAERTGVSYAAFRELGVSPAVLKLAGIKRTRRAN
jgi:uncharacterized Ntn-hydrolase superfamily protein